MFLPRRIDTAPPPTNLLRVPAESSMKKTPLHAEHVRLGAKMVDFGGWSIPVQYTGIIDEHHAVRNHLAKATQA